MKSRPIYDEDIPTLQAAINADTFHPGQWKVEDFRGFSELFEDRHGPIVFVVYQEELGKLLRISTMWVSSDDVHRNGRAIIFLVRSAAERAAAAGFAGLVFTTEHPPLANFCTRALSFRSIGNNEYVKDISPTICQSGNISSVSKEGNDVRPK